MSTMTTTTISPEAIAFIETNKMRVHACVTHPLWGKVYGKVRAVIVTASRDFYKITPKDIMWALDIAERVLEREERYETTRLERMGIKTQTTDRKSCARRNPAKRHKSAADKALRLSMKGAKLGDTSKQQSKGGKKK